MSGRSEPARDPLAAQFLALRPRMLGLAYRMLGTLHDAEDVVQDAYERWYAVAATRSVEDPGALLATVTTRLCIDRYRRERTRREAQPGPWLPEPVATGRDTPFEELETQRLLSLGLLHLLERLPPLERAVFVLAEAFDYRAREIAAVVQRSEVHCRQLLHRARRRVRAEEGAALVAVSDASGNAEDPRRLAALVDALGRGAAEEAAALLAPEVSLISDGGGRVPAVSRPVHGQGPVLRLLLGLARQPEAASLRPLALRLNGVPALVLQADSRLESALVPAWHAQRIACLYVQRDPEKLARLAQRLGIAGAVTASSAGRSL